MIDTYAKELEVDMELSILNLKDRQLAHPTIRHKWLYRLIKHKRRVGELKEELEDLVYELTAKEEKLERVSLPRLNAKIEKDPTVIALKRLKDAEYKTVEYLDGVQNILSSMSFDMKNIVEIMKLENS